MKLFLLSILFISLNALGAGQTIHGDLNVNGRLKAVSTTKASLPCPQMTETQRDAIASPIAGDCVYNTSKKSLNIYDSTTSSWKAAGGGLSFWETGFAYEVNAIVVESNKIYKALTAHTSGTFSTDLAANRWIRLNDEYAIQSAQGLGVATKKLRTPFKQVTKTSTDEVRLETGNKNRLENPGFEHQTALTGWNGTSTGTANPTLGIDPGTAIEGATSGYMSCAGGASGGTCIIYQDVNTSHQLQGLASIYVKSSSASGVKVYSRVNGTNSQSVDVQSLTASLYKIPVILGTTSTGVAIEITVAASQTISVSFDEAFVGAQDLKQDAPAAVETVVKAAGNSGQAITASVTNIPFTTQSDSTGGAWNGSQFTVPEDGIYTFDVSVYFTTTAIRNITLFINGALYKHIGTQVSNAYFSASVSDKFLKGQVVSVRINSAGGTLSVDGTLHYLNITRTSVVKVETYSSTNADTDWRACTFSTLAWTGFGTVVNNSVECKRQGSDLLMRGTLTTGTTTATEARVMLPTWGGAQLALAKSSTYGRVSRGSATASQTKDFVLFGGAVGDSYMKVGAPEYASAQSPFTAFNGNGAFGTGEFISFENLRIPINGWENSNQIIGTFKDVVTSQGSNKADIQSVYFGSGADCTAACTTGNCTICSQVGSKITTVSWGTTGVYNINGIDGTKYHCYTGSGYNNGVAQGLFNKSASSSSMARIQFYSSGTTTVNVGYASVTCIGTP